MKHALAGLALALALGVGLAARVQKPKAAGTGVDITVPDGVTLKGTFYAAAKPAPGILLLHQCNMDRHAWDRLATDLNKAGFNVLTFDFRGFGASGGDRVTNTAKLQPVLEQKWPGDVEAAYAYLLAQPGVTKDTMGAGGASCGAFEAGELAERHPEINALLLVSGRVSPRATIHIEATPGLAVFGAASTEDTEPAPGQTVGPAKGVKQAVTASRNPRSVLKMYPGTLHGVPLFDAHRTLEPEIVQWFKARLGRVSP